MSLVALACSVLLAAASAFASGRSAAQISSGPGSPTIPSIAGPYLRLQTPSSEVLTQATDDPDRAEKIREINERSAKYHAECMLSWDADTQMTKKEWARTCRRVADERTKFMLDQLK
jgi:hypothetical protein